MVRAARVSENSDLMFRATWLWMEAARVMDRGIARGTPSPIIYAKEVFRGRGRPRLTGRRHVYRD